MTTASFIKYWAMNILFANLDSYNGSGHNYYVYNDPDFNRFFFIAWDVNEAFGCFTQGMSISQLENLNISYLPNGRPLVQKMLADPSCFNQYKVTLCEYILQDFNSAFFDPIIDSISDVVRSSVYADPKKFFTNQQFEDNRTISTGGAPGLKPFIANRVSSISTQLNSLCFTSSGEIENTSSVAVYPEPATSYVKISIDSNPIVGVDIYNMLGEKILSSEGGITSGRSEINLNVSDWQAGIYFFMLETGPNTIQGKFSVQH